MLDTNVLVSALLKPGGNPARVLDLVVGGALILLWDSRILYEYREVLRRSKFSLDALLVDDLVALLEKIGESVTPLPLSYSIPDQDDLPFLEVALGGCAAALVTGNTKDYGPSVKGLSIVNPADFLRIFGREKKQSS